MTACAVTVYVELGDFTLDDLTEELRRRGKVVSDDIGIDERLCLDQSPDWLRAQADVPRPMRDLVYSVLGRVL